jgi:hypothetical protein
MIKKQQKWIALLVTLTFMGLLQVSTMPVAAANTTEQIASANAEQAPSFIEEEGDSSYQPKKKSILPVILIGVGVVALAAVLFLVVLKTKYDIMGTWTVNYNWTGGTSGSTEMLFVGDRKSGDVKMLNVKFGTYTVDGKKVTWAITFIVTATYVGTFTDKTHMSGTMTNTKNDSGTWTAVLKAAATAANPGDPRSVVGLPSQFEK